MHGDHKPETFLASNLFLNKSVITDFLSIVVSFYSFNSTTKTFKIKSLSKGRMGLLSKEYIFHCDIIYAWFLFPVTVQDSPDGFGILTQWEDNCCSCQRPKGKWSLIISYFPTCNIVSSLLFIAFPSPSCCLPLYLFVCLSPIMCMFCFAKCPSYCLSKYWFLSFVSACRIIMYCI